MGFVGRALPLLAILHLLLYIFLDDDDERKKQGMTISEIPPRTRRSFELSGEYWFNSEPVPISALHGKVILLQFWDFSSVASQRSIPYVEEWFRRYEPHGLVVVGVHVPKYDFSSKPEEVVKSIARYGMTYPVMCDNQHQVAAVYDIRSTPSMILLDQEGFVRYQCTGDGDYESIEHAIRSLLHGLGSFESLPLPFEPIREEDRRGAVRYRVTPDLHAGYLRGNVGNAGNPLPESVDEYIDPEIYIDGKLYAAGTWYNGRDFLRLDVTGKKEGRLLVRYHAVEVHAVLSPDREPGFEVTISQDGKFLSIDNRGEDVLFAEDGRSFITVSGPRSYSLVRNPEPDEHTLCLTVGPKPLSLFSFVFVSGVIPETVSRN